VDTTPGDMANDALATAPRRPSRALRERFEIMVFEPSTEPENRLGPKAVKHLLGEMARGGGRGREPAWRPAGLPRQRHLQGRADLHRRRHRSQHAELVHDRAQLAASIDTAAAPGEARHRVELPASGDGEGPLNLKAPHHMT
jgi:hypothetical protein